MKTCKNKKCRAKFEPVRQFQTTCGYECAIEYAKQLQEKKQKDDKKEANKAKRKFNSSDRSKLLKEAQTAFNAYIRARDGKVCISCGYSGDGRIFHAGHYKSQGGNSSLRFDENNVHSQCVKCNMFLSGNLANYRISLIEKIGIDEVLKLETNKEHKKWTIDELKEIKAKYTEKANLLKNK